MASPFFRSERRTRRLSVVLIKPSKYDDDGYVIRYRRGFLPSNTLACLAALTQDIIERRLLGDDVAIDLTLLDDTVQAIPVRSLARRGGTTVACLVGVQTNQFPRASDLALAFRREGCQVLLGGFHVSGSLAMLPETPPEIQALIDAGVGVVAGEVEGRWADILRDVLSGTLRPVYNYLGSPPELDHQPLPIPDRRYLRHFVTSNFGTIDAGRGCPFHCSFCTIINVQGRRMRCRDAATLLDGVRENYAKRGISFYFLTDDNFARNRHWEAILDGFIRLREEEGIPLEFMMQVDVLAHRIKDFVSKARRAGCTQVFLGMESLNPANLEAAEKTQNKVEDLAGMVEAFHREEIMTHVAYIVGFPFDTVDSVREDIRRLTQDLRVKQASFFMLTPLPGSADHVSALAAGVPLERDFNLYDTLHATMPHPRMSAEEWTGAYRDAWRAFYSLENMKAILEHTSTERYWNVFKNFIWAKSSMEIEDQHPMISGYFRRKPRRDRRAGASIEGAFVHAGKRIRESARKARGWFMLIMEMEELWLQTRRRSAREQVIAEEIRSIRKGIREWSECTVREIHGAYRRAVERLHAEDPVGRLSAPSRVSIAIARLNVLSDRMVFSRQSLAAFWRQTARDLRRGKVYRVRPDRLVVNFVRDLALVIQFALAMFASGIR